jgi:hypothetical protein
MGRTRLKKPKLTLRTVLEKNPTVKRPIGKPRMRWEDVVKNNVDELKRKLLEDASN